ncbi:MAG: 23S rRNA pseudouridine2605 synthase [Candidatus Midichloriaceae bacterium]|jgi:23S rRNA pseudouridine2605 synthase
MSESKVRISKFLSLHGVCSRREAERLILDGCVRVNQSILKTPVYFINDEDEVFVKNKLVKKVNRVRLWKYFKPKCVITTHKDEFQRTTLFETLPKELGRVISVGRLDYKTEGLILLTNNGELSRTLELPKTNLKRTYLCKAHGSMPNNMINELEMGLKIGEVQYASIRVEFIRNKGSNNWYKIILTEGKNREIRNVFEYYNMQVSRLIRLSFGEFSAGNMKDGDLIEIDELQFKKYL